MTHLPLTDYQLDTIRTAIDIFNALPICPHHGMRHVGPDNPNLADYELLILVDAGCIMEEWDLSISVIPGTTKVEIIGVT